MNTPHTLKRIIAGTLLSGGVAVAGLGVAGLGEGIAKAEDWCSPAAMVNNVCYGPNRGCPGDSLFQLTQNHITNPINWDMNVCHTYYYVPYGQGNVGQDIWEGANPPPPQTLPPPHPLPPGTPSECSPWCDRH
jgi:hypothetical protein